MTDGDKRMRAEGGRRRGTSSLDEESSSALSCSHRWLVRRAVFVQFICWPQNIFLQMISIIMLPHSVITTAGTGCCGAAGRVLLSWNLHGMSHVAPPVGLRCRVRCRGEAGRRCEAGPCDYGTPSTLCLVDIGIMLHNGWGPKNAELNRFDLNQFVASGWCYAPPVTRLHVIWRCCCCMLSKILKVKDM